jgi:large subunit ribosomal protein L22
MTPTPKAARAPKAKAVRVRAIIRYVHSAPQKVRRVADLVRSLDVNAAEHILASLPKRAATPVWKAIASAASNAVHNHELDRSRLFIETIQVNQSMMLPRFMPRAQGRAFKVRKRFSHVEVSVAERPVTKKA